MGIKYDEMAALPCNFLNLGHDIAMQNLQQIAYFWPFLLVAIEFFFLLENNTASKRMQG